VGCFRQTAFLSRPGGRLRPVDRFGGARRKKEGWIAVIGSYNPRRNWLNVRLIEIVWNISPEFAQADFDTLADYRCDQFVHDYDWWYRSWPTD